MRSIAPLALLGTLALVEVASAGVIRGRVTLGRPPAGPPQAEPGVNETVVYVEAVPEKVERKLSGSGWFFFRRPEPRPLRIVQADLRFKPRVLATTAGRPVEFLNLDHVYHNAFSVSAAKRFDLGKNAPGRTDTVLFERPGVVNVHCDIHPNELGFIVVVPNHVIARPDSMGRYVLPRLPAGTYDVRAWHPRRGEIQRMVVMPKHGDLQLDLGF